VLGALPASFPGAVVVVQHVGAEFSGDLAEWIATQSAISVRIVDPPDRPRAATAIVAGGGHDLVLTRGLDLVCEPPAPDSFYHPSADVFFKSVARHWPRRGLAILLTGIGRDGAEGLLALRRAGWQTIAQDEASSVVYGMPKAAAALGAAVDVLPLDQIAAAIVRFADAPAASRRTHP
jgi:two-component system response regulator WspF